MKSGNYSLILLLGKKEANFMLDQHLLQVSKLKLDTDSMAQVERPDLGVRTGVTGLTPAFLSCPHARTWGCGSKTTVAPLNGGDDSVASSISLSTEHLFENAYYHQNNKKISMFPLSSFLLCSLSFSFSLYFFSFFS